MVLSEVAYYLTRPELLDLVERLRPELAPGATVLGCHWRHPVAEHAQTGDDVQATLDRALGLARVASYRDADVALDVWCADPASVADREGLLPAPKLELSTVQPLGLARAWAYAWPTQTLLVYPAPETQAPPLPVPAGTQGSPQAARAGDDPHHLRAYRPGDAPRSVAWKASARHDSLLVRDYEQQRGGDLLLDWQQTLGLPYEQRIRRLARWVDDAEREGRRYALQLPAQAAIAADQGAAHRHRCLRALALLPQEQAHG